MISLRRYTAADAPLWDTFVKGSKNGTLLFLRGYMDYHSSRFNDCSLMFFDHKDRLIALLPANISDDTLWSHQGLTYGGFVLSADVRAAEVLELFSITKSYLRQQGTRQWIYRQLPTIYHRCPSQEDDYALWRNEAEMVSCLISTTIPLNGSTLYPVVERRRHRGERRAQEAGYTIAESTRLDIFWPIMETNLKERYGVSPVHTLQEMQLLMERFPDSIRLFLATKDGKAEAGAVVYECNDMVVHIQYGHATPQGKSDGALDMLYLQLMERYRSAGFAYLDFGNSNEQGGHYLNEQLIAQKEGFGGRGIAYKTFKLTLENLESLETLETLENP